MDGLKILEDQYQREAVQIARRHARQPEGLPEAERTALVKLLQGQMALWAEAGGDEKAFPLAPQLEKLMTAGEPEPEAERTALEKEPDTDGEPPPPGQKKEPSGDPAPDTADDEQEVPQDTDASGGDAARKGAAKDSGGGKR